MIERIDCTYNHLDINHRTRGLFWTSWLNGRISLTVLSDSILYSVHNQVTLPSQILLSHVSFVKSQLNSNIKLMPLLQVKCIISSSTGGLFFSFVFQPEQRSSGNGLWQRHWTHCMFLHTSICKTLHSIYLVFSEPLQENNAATLSLETMEFADLHFILPDQLTIYMYRTPHQSISELHFSCFVGASIIIINIHHDQDVVW